MAENTDITRIRTLLAKFYAGESSASDEHELADFFSRQDDALLPADLAADKRVFDSLRAVQPTAEQAAVPDELGARLKAIVDAPVPRKRARVLPVMLRWCGAAAAACVIWALITFIPSLTRDGVEQSSLVAVVTPALHAEPEPTTEETTEATAPIETKASHEQTEPQVRQLAAPESPKPVIARSDEEPDDGFTEITDPEEARRIAAQIGNLLASVNHSESDRALRQVSSSIVSYKEITKTIVQ